jgi:hypothetical protein
LSSTLSKISGTFDSEAIRNVITGTGIQQSIPVSPFILLGAGVLESETDILTSVFAIFILNSAF